MVYLPSLIATVKLIVSCGYEDGMYESRRRIPFITLPSSSSRSAGVAPDSLRRAFVARSRAAASSLAAPRRLPTARPSADSRLLSVPRLRPRWPPSARRASGKADRLDLAFNVGEEGRVVVAPQPLFDQSPEDDLKAHGKLERGRRPPRKDPGPIEDIPGENEEDARLIEHHVSRLGPTRRDRPSQHYMSYIIYIVMDVKRGRPSGASADRLPRHIPTPGSPRERRAGRTATTRFLRSPGSRGIPTARP
jgi:hypothetical protein